jgi:hypothetical protein
MLSGLNAVARIVTVRQGNRIDSTALGSRRFSQCRGIQACYTARTLGSIEHLSISH